ncbi:hypothetical protein ABT147_28035 [Streptomyces sp. NPDC001868]|uniref:hypothetical protein n=1 Tax=Streptomyces sp. NPDC001868 TaxID=3154401 RepID=UPI00332374D5
MPQKHGYNSDVVAQFKVRRPGEAKTVAWGEFCHGPASDDQVRLYERLASRSLRPGRRRLEGVAVPGQA